MIDLGHTYKDIITGFVGVAIGHVEYMTGCNQTLLAPKVSENGERREGHWFDDDRLQVLSDVDPIELEIRNPGPDQAPPLR